MSAPYVASYAPSEKQQRPSGGWRRSGAVAYALRSVTDLAHRTMGADPREGASRSAGTVGTATPRAPRGARIAVLRQIEVVL
jgi:hypothetical protein